MQENSSDNINNNTNQKTQNIFDQNKENQIPLQYYYDFILKHENFKKRIHNRIQKKWFRQKQEDIETEKLLFNFKYYKTQILLASIKKGYYLFDSDQKSINIMKMDIEQNKILAQNHENHTSSLQNYYNQHLNELDSEKCQYSHVGSDFNEQAHLDQNLDASEKILSLNENCSNIQMENQIDFQEEREVSRIDIISDDIDELSSFKYLKRQSDENQIIEMDQSSFELEPQINFDQKMQTSVSSRKESTYIQELQNNRCLHFLEIQNVIQILDDLIEKQKKQALNRKINKKCEKFICQKDLQKQKKIQRNIFEEIFNFKQITEALKSQDNQKKDEIYKNLKRFLAFTNRSELLEYLCTEQRQRKKNIYIYQSSERIPCSGDQAQFISMSKRKIEMEDIVLLNKPIQFMDENIISNIDWHQDTKMRGIQRNGKQSWQIVQSIGGKLIFHSSFDNILLAAVISDFLAIQDRDLKSKTNFIYTKADILAILSIKSLSTILSITLE